MNKTYTDRVGTPKEWKYENTYDGGEIEALYQKTFFEGNMVKSQKDVDARIGDFVSAVMALGWTPVEKIKVTYESCSGSKGSFFVVTSNAVFKRKVA